MKKRTKAKSGKTLLNSREKTGLVCYYNVITMSPINAVLNSSSVGLETTA